MIYGRQSCDTRKLEEDASIDVGNAKFGGQEALVVLDHVFIPNEYIFLNGEYEFAGMMVERFAGYHRQSYGGCKVGVGDTLIGAAALAAEYNGVEKASAVKDKLIEMIHLNETLYCCGIACSSQGFRTKAGNYQIDLLLANVCKQNVTRFPYEIVRLAEDIAGGLVVTMPSQKDFHSDTVVGRNGETIGEICNKFFATREGVSTEDRQRILRFIENLCLGAAAVGYRTESMHGAGSPQAQRIMIARQGNLQAKKQMAKEIAGIQNYGPTVAALRSPAPDGPPSAPLPRNRLACSAAGGASPVSPSRSHSEHVDPAGRGVLPEVNSCKTEFHKQTCRNISYIVAFSKFEYKEKTSWISISAVSTSWSGR